MIRILVLPVLGLLNTKMTLNGVLSTILEVVPVKNPLGEPGRDSTQCPYLSPTTWAL